MTQHVSTGAIYTLSDEAARAALAALPDLEQMVATALTDPKPLDINMPVLAAVLAAQYLEVFQALDLPKDMAVYEPCVGASCPVILAEAGYTAGKGKYLTINLNQKLCNELEPKIAHLTLPILVIADNAQTALQHLAPDSFDAACFHHAVNDILQTAVSEPRGMDTTQIDWFPNERQMIEWLAEDAAAGRLESRGKPELMQIIADAVRLIRPGGCLIFDHFNWHRFIGVQWFPWDLFYNFIPMTRQWIQESGLPVSEVHLDGVDPQWWMGLRAT